MKKQEKMNKNMGQRIKEARIEKGLTQKQLADLIGTNQHVICNYENGNHSPSMNSLIKLENALKINLQPFDPINYNMSNIGQRIKEARIRKRLTQQQLADLIGITKAMISLYEDSKNIPRISNIAKLEKVLDININNILEPLEFYPIFKSIVNIIKYRRCRLSIIDELSNISHLSINTINDIENGYNNNIQDIITLDNILYKLEQEYGIKSKKIIELNLEIEED